MKLILNHHIRAKLIHSHEHFCLKRLPFHTAETMYTMTKKQKLCTRNIDCIKYDSLLGYINMTLLIFIEIFFKY